jgi:AGCS family alanine or glycine:cation symporter
MQEFLRATIDFAGDIGGAMWGPTTFFVLMGAGILFTLWTRFGQFKALTHGVAVVRGKYDKKDDPGAISHFQALSAALSATVGLGNIGGVALAIGAGGPGALFWMWIIGFFGMALKTVEVSLAMLYRDTDDPDNPHGGAMWVIDRTLGAKGGVFKTLAKILGVTFCVTLVISTITGGNMFQSWNVAALSFNYFGIPHIVTGIVLASIVGMVIVGGIKRIGTVAGKLVPFMCVLYVVAALVVVLKNFTMVPGLIGEIITSAFSPEEATGAFLGGSIYWAFSTGLRRALFSNEAGQGSAPIAHSAAKTDEPVREGVVAGLEPFIDTICICTLTALVILSTGTWNRQAEDPFGAPVQLTASAANEQGVVTWSVETDGGIADLPAPANKDEWTADDKFFFVAEFDGGGHRSDTGFNRVQIEGVIAHVDPDDDQSDLHIVWTPLEVSPDDWHGAPGNPQLIDQGVFQSFEGAPLTAFAFDKEFPGLGKWLVTLAAWLFAISTMISWSYYGEQGMIYMAGQWAVLPYKIAFLALAIVATFAINSTSDMEKLMDLGTGAMLFANMPIVLLMGFIAVKELDRYFKRLKAGEFHPHAAKSITDLVEGDGD